MPIVFRLLLAFGVGLLCVFLINLPDVIKEVREDKEKLKKAGCHCPTRFWFLTEISPECPVHGKFCNISEHTAWNGHKYVIFPAISIERVPVCRDCLESTIQENFSLFYHMQINDCTICQREKLCAMVPKNLVDDWVEDNVFHFSQSGKKVDRASRRDKDINTSVSPKELD